MSKSFEDQWKDALQNASENPPKMVWDKIEQELDKKEESRVLPLWFSPRWIAAGMAAMLVMVIGYGVLQQPKNTNIAEQKTTKKVKAGKTQNSNSKSVMEQATTKILSNNELPFEKKGNTESEKRGYEKGGNLAKANIVDLKEKDGNISRNASKTKNIEIVPLDDNKGVATFKQEINIEVIAKLNDKKSIARTEVFVNDGLSNTEKGNIVESIILTNDNKEQRMYSDIEPLETLAFQEYGSRFVNKRKMLDVNIEPDIVENDITNDKVYFGMSSGLSPYNTNFEANGFVGEAVAAARSDIGQAYSLRSPSAPSEALPQADAGFAANVLPSNLPQNTFKAGSAINVGFSVGKKIWKKFSVETGLRYLRSSSNMQSNVYTINQKSGKVVPFFQEKYINSKSQDFQTIISFTENYEQVYNYVGVPLNLVYDIPLLKNFSVSLFAGVSGDFFVGSSYTSTFDEKTKLNAQDTNFNTFNLSGMQGLRLNYGLGTNWAIHVGAINQHALHSGISGANGATFKPNMLGVNYGVKYQIGD